MTKRDFEIIADIIREANYLDTEQRGRLAAEFCIRLEKEYPRFDPIPFCKRALADLETSENIPADPALSSYHNPPGGSDR